jgi:hypothetical protein
MNVSSNWRSFAGVTSGLFFAAVITWIILYGKPENSLHASALSWSFTALLGLLVSVGFSEIVQVVMPKVSVTNVTNSTTTKTA